MNTEPDPSEYDIDAFEAKGPYIPAKTRSELERNFITRLEEHLGRVPCEAEIVAFCMNVICLGRAKQYILWKGELLFYTDIVP